MSVREEWEMECPKCHRDDRLQVQVMTWANLTEDGTDPDGDHEWEPDSRCLCNHCDWQGRVKDAHDAFDQAESEDES